MKGVNTIHVNEATMMAAFQMYLDSTHKEGKSPVVKNVKSRSTGMNEYFEVSIAERNDADNPKGA